MLALAAFIYAPNAAAALITAEEAKLSEFVASESSADDLRRAIAQEKSETAAIKERISAYNDVPVEKDIFLSELAALSGMNGVEMTRFSEVTKEAPAIEQYQEPEQNQENIQENILPPPEPGVVVKTYSVTLKGENTALYRTLGAIEALSETHRITAVSWVSDYVAGIIPKISDGSSLLEVLADKEFLEAYKVTDMAFVETSAMSFTIEYIYRPDGGVAAE